jgi:hypothetical protein
MTLSKRALLAVLAVAALPAPAPAQAPAPAAMPDPLAPLKWVYARLDKGRDKEPFSKRLLALQAAAAKRSQELSEPLPGLDFDYAINGQDSERGTAKSVRYKIASQDSAKANVTVTFRNGGLQTLHYSLVFEGGKWLIDDVANPKKGEEWTLSALYIEAAKTPKS